MSVALVWQFLPCPRAGAAEGVAVEPSLVLQYAGGGVSNSLARSFAERLPVLLRRDLSVRWVAAAREEQGAVLGGASFPVADGAAVARISALVGEARLLAERMETGRALRLLDEAEGQARKFRLSEATRPLLADVFLWRGALLLWEGRREEAEASFARSQALRPDFSPDPALFSPLIRDSWERARRRRLQGAELVVSTLPGGARILVDGVSRGVSPARVRVKGDGPATLRVEREGYRPVERAGQWLPGDTEVIDIVLPPDRAAAIGEILARDPAGPAAAEAVAELAASAGATQVAVVLLDGTKEGRPVRVRLLSWRGEAGRLALAGEFLWDGEAQGVEDQARAMAAALKRAGWPEEAKPGGRPWYHSLWFWGLVGAAVVGVAAGLGGGGGSSSGGSTGTIGVTF